MRTRRLEAALAGALLPWLGACAALSGLSKYSANGDGTDDGAAADATTAADAPAGSDATEATDAAGDGSTEAGGCGTGLVLCDGGCVDSTSVSNCGACGNVCTGGTPVCASASGTYSCVASCPASAPADCSGTCADTTTDPKNCMMCGAACMTTVANGQPSCASSACGFTCKSGYTLCNGACVDEQSNTNNCGGCGSGHMCTAGQTCQGGACAALDGGSDGCTQVSLPPSIDVDTTRWTAAFKTSPTWNCNAAGTTTIDSNAGTISSTSCALGTLDFTNNVTQSVAGGPTVMVVRLQGLTVTNGHVLRLQGNKPIVFLVAGNVLVDLGGKIDAGATGTTPGPGGSIAANCSGSTGASDSQMQWGGGGGGFGTAGGYGSNGNGSAAAGGAASSGTNLQPLRGGCSGGTGGNGAGAAGAGGGAFEISASGTITIGTGTNTATLSAAGGGSPAVTTNQNVGSGGAGSGGGILLVSPGAATFGASGAARAHGGASGASEGCSCNRETSADNGQDGHSADNTAAAGGRSVDVNAANGASGGLCAGNNCGTASAAGAHGTPAQAAVSASGGGGGGGSIQVVTGPATLACN